MDGGAGQALGPAALLKGHAVHHPGEPDLRLAHKSRGVLLPLLPPAGVDGGEKVEVPVPQRTPGFAAQQGVGHGLGDGPVGHVSPVLLDEGEDLPGVGLGGQGGAPLPGQLTEALLLVAALLIRGAQADAVRLQLKAHVLHGGIGEEELRIRRLLLAGPGAYGEDDDQGPAPHTLHQTGQSGEGTRRAGGAVRVRQTQHNGGLLGQGPPGALLGRRLRAVEGVSEAKALVGKVEAARLIGGEKGEIPAKVKRPEIWRPVLPAPVVVRVPVLIVHRPVAPARSVFQAVPGAAVAFQPVLAVEEADLPPLPDGLVQPGDDLHLEPAAPLIGVAPGNGAGPGVEAVQNRQEALGLPLREEGADQDQGGEQPPLRVAEGVLQVVPPGDVVIFHGLVAGQVLLPVLVGGHPFPPPLPRNLGHAAQAEGEDALQGVQGGAHIRA